MTIGRTKPANRGIDALLPAEIAEKAELVGVQKTKLDVLSLLALAILAGAFIALGAMFATTVLAGADGVLPFGLSRLLAGIAFCLGLILVILGGAELFTGNALMVRPRPKSLTFPFWSLPGPNCQKSLRNSSRIPVC